MILDTRSTIPQPTARTRLADEKGTALFVTEVMASAPWIEAFSSASCSLHAAPQVDYKSGGAPADMAAFEPGFGVWDWLDNYKFAILAFDCFVFCNLVTWLVVVEGMNIKCLLCWKSAS